MIDIEPLKNDPRYKAIALHLEEYGDMIEVAKGSSHNHQTWNGGYVDHINQCFAIAKDLFATYGRILPFTLESALVVLYFHDIEKVWKDTNVQFNKENFLKYGLKAEFDIELTEDEWNAITFIHGEGNHYRKDKRVMNELAAFCHACDILSARCFHSVRII